MSYARFAIYYVPPEGALADFGAAWLGWDIARGRAALQPDLSGLAGITETPRKYGFHGTLKPPFRLAGGAAPEDLERAVAQLAAELTPASCAGLELTALGRFLALMPHGDTGPLNALAAACVRGLDRFRAPLSADELARRRKARLSDRQDALLRQWGYPYVLEQFRFHLTLTGPLPKPEIAAWTATARQQLPDLPAPFTIDQIALCGERADGRFELVRRYALGA